MIFSCFCSSPETVRLCLLPEMAETDVTVQIHHKLVEAFCWENDIEVVKVRLHKSFCCHFSETGYSIKYM